MLLSCLPGGVVVVGGETVRGRRGAGSKEGEDLVGGTGWATKGLGPQRSEKEKLGAAGTGSEFTRGGRAGEGAAGGSEGVGVIARLHCHRWHSPLAAAGTPASPVKLPIASARRPAEWVPAPVARPPEGTTRGARYQLVSAPLI